MKYHFKKKILVSIIIQDFIGETFIILRKTNSETIRYENR